MFALLVVVEAVRADDPLVPTDLAALKAHIGQDVEVKGTVASVGKSPSGGIIFVNFDKKAPNALVVIFFTSGSYAGTVKSDDELKPLVGKEVTVKGELTAFKDDIQMVLHSADELHVTP